MSPKRALDVMLACFLAPLPICLLPVMWLVGRVEGSGGPFYRQDRIGLDGGTLRLLKFRTIGSPRNPLPARLFLKLARTLGLDELPQILLVARGDMSFVGPRPLLPKELFRYRGGKHVGLPAAIDLRQSAMPGITGLAQISIRTRERRGASYWQMLERDLWYAENRSMGLDLLILVFTPLYVMSLGRILFPRWLIRGRSPVLLIPGESDVVSHPVS